MAKKKPVKRKSRGGSQTLPPVHCKHTRLVKTAAIKPNPKNPNKHPVGQIELLAKLIKAQGWRAPITVSNLSGMVVRGHGRLEAARLLKLEKCPVDFQDYKSKSEELADLITDNRIAELANVDFETLASTLGDIKDADRLLTAYTADQLLETLGLLEPDIRDDLVPDPPKKPKTKPGDLYVLGNHRLLCGDATNIDDVEKLMDAKKADMVLTDPPYGVDYSDKNIFLNAIGPPNRIETPILGDKNTEDVFILWEKSFALVSKHTKPGASFYCCAPQGGNQMMMIMIIKAKFNPTLHQLIWVKNNHVLGRVDYSYKHEPIFYTWKLGASHKFYGGFQTSIIEVDKPQKSKLHPTTKPIKLFEKFIINSSRENHMVLDLFLGSGSTLIACEKTARQCYGMEIDPHYCDVIVKRWENYTGNKARRDSRTN